MKPRWARFVPQEIVDAMVDPALARRVYRDPVVRVRIVEAAERARVLLEECALVAETQDLNAPTKAAVQAMYRDAAKALVAFKAGLVS